MSPNVRVPTVAEVRAWPVTVSVPEAGRCWRIGRDASYDLARLGEFPVPVLRLGTALRVTRASIMAALGIPDEPVTPSSPLAMGALALVQATASDIRSDARDSPEAA